MLIGLVIFCFTVFFLGIFSAFAALGILNEAKALTSDVNANLFETRLIINEFNAKYPDENVKNNSQLY